MRTLVLGLGNPILGDDGVGIRVAESVQGRLPANSAVEVDTDFWGGLRLMERLVGYDRAIIIDAICTGRRPPGTLLWLGPDDLPTQHSASAHDVNLPTALRLATAMRLKIPETVILAIEARNVLDFDERLSAEVAAAVPAAVEAVLAEATRCGAEGETAAA